jgi:hypothetical protein
MRMVFMKGTMTKTKNFKLKDKEIFFQRLR